MTDYVETRADCKTASVASVELSETELSTVAGGTGKKGKVTPQPFVFVHLYDKSSPVLQ
jgi:type VI protein secretion system component Hcp